MAVYVYSEEQIERMVAKSRRLRIRFGVAAIVILVMTVHDIRILLANLVIAVGISVSGFLIVNANPDNHQIHRARIGVFVPVVFAVLGFLLRN